MLIGILAIQGNFESHAAVLQRLNITFCFVKSVEQLKTCDALIIPGGESTTILKFILENKLFDALLKFNKPIFGTCAGAILLAKKVINPTQQSLGLMDIVIERNGYGRQLDSKIRPGKNNINHETCELVFIRAPRIQKVGDHVKVLVQCEDEPVGLQQNNCFITTFHPELSNDLFWHRYFIEELCV